VWNSAQRQQQRGYEYELVNSYEYRYVCSCFLLRHFSVNCYVIYLSYKFYFSSYTRGDMSKSKLHGLPMSQVLGPSMICFARALTFDSKSIMVNVLHNSVKKLYFTWPWFFIAWIESIHRKTSTSAATAFLYRTTALTNRGQEHYSSIAMFSARRNQSEKSSSNKTVKKENLPTKICVVCQRPFTWRKKWERCWDEVTTCSKRCNGERRRSKGEEP
jgi:hypothetical protein